MAGRGRVAPSQRLLRLRGTDRSGYADFGSRHISETTNVTALSPSMTNTMPPQSS